MIKKTIQKQNDIDKCNYTEESSKCLKYIVCNNEIKTLISEEFATST